MQQLFRSVASVLTEKAKTDKVWIFESVGKLKVVVHQSKEKMNELSIHTIADIQIHVRYHGIPKVPIRGVGQIYDISLQALLGNTPTYFKDHRKLKNPYILWYGEIWVDKLKSSTAMLKFCCITDLIRFMTNEAENMMKW